MSAVIIPRREGHSRAARPKARCVPCLRARRVARRRAQVQSRPIRGGHTRGRRCESRLGQGLSCGAPRSLRERFQCSRALVLPTRICGVGRAAPVAAADARIGGAAPRVKAAAAELLLQKWTRGAYVCAVFALLYYGGAATTATLLTGAAAAAETPLHG